jgi:HK97 family phage major capsid protein
VALAEAIDLTFPALPQCREVGTLPTLKERLIRERTDLVDEQAKLVEGDKEFTAEEQKRDDEIASRIAEIDPQLKAIERREANAESNKKYVEWMAEAAPKPAPRVEVKPAWENDTEKRGFAHQQDFFNAIMVSSQTQRLDERLKPLQVKPAQMKATAGSDENMRISDPYGGFLVPAAFSPDLLRIRPESDPIGGFTTRVPMMKPIVKMPARVDTDHSSSVAGGLTVGRTVETQAATASRMQFSQVVLEAHSLFGYSFATEELISDSPISWTAAIEQGFSDAFAGRILDERINGSGVGEFMGILKSAALVAVSSSQTADTIKYANLAGMLARCWGYGNAVWLFNHDCLPEIMTIQDGAGAYIWQPSAREGVPGMIFGRPAYTCEYCQTLGDQGDILLVNWSEYLEGIYQPMQSAESIHVRFAEHERAFKFWIRNAGVPWWKAALTPAVSSTTLSPYVTLAARA